MNARPQPSADEPEPARPDAHPERFRWWQLVVWPVAPLTFVGIAVWSLLELVGSF